MKTKIDSLPVGFTIEEFAIQHDLTMHLRENANGWKASFEHCEVKDGCLLRSWYGSGISQESAIRDYIPQISARLLVIDASGRNRKEINAPRLVGSYPNP